MSVVTEHAAVRRRCSVGFDAPTPWLRLKESRLHNSRADSVVVDTGPAVSVRLGRRRDKDFLLKLRHPAVETVASIWRTWGGWGLARRARYELQRETGLTSRAEVRWLAAVAGADLSLRALEVDVPAGQAMTSGPLPTDGVIVGYGQIELVSGWPPRWHRHPSSGVVLPADQHWSKLVEHDAARHDIKDVWELSRLTWLADLVYAWRTSGDERPADAVWVAIESWIAANPPYLGPNWMCGQEASLRAMSVLMAASALRAHASTTPERLHLVAEFLATSVGRVLPTTGYALSQRNNHAISEGSFLWIAATLVDGLPAARRVERTACRLLETAIEDQFEPDGSYAQHSPTYQRLAVHALLLVLAAARAVDRPPPPSVKAAISRSQRFLAAMMEPSTGSVPNLGHNDGAILLPLIGAKIRDFRPMLAHAAAATDTPLDLPSGPWDDAPRTFGLERREPTGPAGDLTAPIAHHLHRSRRSLLLLKAGPGRHRPAHADQLNVDLWIDRVNVVRDPGTYRYSAPAPWENALAGEEVHSLPRVPGVPQARRRGRFLWTMWQSAVVVAKTRGRDLDATLVRLSLGPGVSLRRLAIRIGDEHIIADVATRNALIRWNLPQEIVLRLEPGSGTLEGDGWHGELRGGELRRLGEARNSDPASGWESTTYGVRTPISVVTVAARSGVPAVARFGPVGTNASPLSRLDRLGDALAARTSEELQQALVS